jgi:phosphoribosyl 1,2-cyclic phosphodiesterase
LKRSNEVLFLGTAGGRITTFRLVRRSGGFLIKFQESLLHVDPGPGAFVYLIRDYGIDPRDIDLVVLSHFHLDHSADLNTLIEAATDGGRKRNVSLFAPLMAIEGDDKVLLPYLRRRLVREGILEEGKELTYKGLRVKAVMRHVHHGAETYGLMFNDRVVYISCAKFEERMLEVYPKDRELLIINTTFYSRRDAVDHLSAEDAKVLISGLRPQRAVITHYSMEMHQKPPEAVAEELTKSTGIPTLAASDGMILELRC